MIAFLWLIGSLVVSQDAPTSQEAHKNELVSINSVYNENRSKFKDENFKFIYVKYENTSLDEASAHRFGKSYSTVGEYNFNEREAKFVRLFADDDLRATSKIIGSNQVVSHLQSTRAITNTKRTIMELNILNPSNIIDHVVTLTDGASEFYDRVEFPMDLGFPEESRRDMSNDLKALINGREAVSLSSVDHNVDYKGTLVTSIKFTYKDYEKTYYVDLEKSCMPLYTELRHRDGKKFVRILADLQFLPGRGWLPLSFLIHSGDSGRYIKVEPSPITDTGRSRFRLEFTSPPTIRETATRTYLKASKSVSLDNINNFTKKRSGKSDAAKEPELPGEQEPRSNLFLMVILGSVATLLGLVALWRRLNRARAL